MSLMHRNIKKRHSEQGEKRKENVGDRALAPGKAAKSSICLSLNFPTWD